MRSLFLLASFFAAQVAGVLYPRCLSLRDVNRFLVSDGNVCTCLTTVSGTPVVAVSCSPSLLSRPGAHPRRYRHPADDYDYDNSLLDDYLLLKGFGHHGGSGGGKSGGYEGYGGSYYGKET